MCFELNVAFDWGLAHPQSEERSVAKFLWWWCWRQYCSGGPAAQVGTTHSPNWLLLQPCFVAGSFSLQAVNGMRTLKPLCDLLHEQMPSKGAKGSSEFWSGWNEGHLAQECWYPRIRISVFFFCLFVGFCLFNRSNLTLPGKNLNLWVLTFYSFSLALFSFIKYSRNYYNLHIFWVIARLFFVSCFLYFTFFINFYFLFK